MVGTTISHYNILEYLGGSMSPALTTVRSGGQIFPRTSFVSGRNFELARLHGPYAAGPVSAVAETETLVAPTAPRSGDPAFFLREVSS
jgi:hypothetical protein